MHTYHVHVRRLEGLRPYTVQKGCMTAAAEILKRIPVIASLQVASLQVASLQVVYIASFGRR